MRAIIQRVSEASVTIDLQVEGKIGLGLLVLLGVEPTDSNEDIDWLISKILQMRIFSDAEDKMNESVLDQKGELLVISQFTLHASTKKGNRPSFIKAAKPEIAIPLYEEFLKRIETQIPGRLQKGIFGADMKVQLINDGPVTISLDTKNRE